jgi:plasmid stabilization system protein ParE
VKLRLLAPALAELDEATAWYAAKSDGLDRRFLTEIETARTRILEWPHAWHPLGRGLRRYRLKSFPYGVIYAVRKDEIVVVAIAHLHREPFYWRDRLKST